MTYNELQPEIEGEVEVKQPVSEDTSAENKNHAKIEAWFTKHFHGSIVSGDTAIYNHCYRAKEELKELFN